MPGLSAITLPKDANHRTRMGKPSPKGYKLATAPKYLGNVRDDVSTGPPSSKNVVATRDFESVDDTLDALSVGGRRHKQGIRRVDNHDVGDPDERDEPAAL